MKPVRRVIAHLANPRFRSRGRHACYGIRSALRLLLGGRGGNMVGCHRFELWDLGRRIGGPLLYQLSFNPISILPLSPRHRKKTPEAPEGPRLRCQAIGGDGGRTLDLQL